MNNQIQNRSVIKKFAMVLACAAVLGGAFIYYQYHQVTQQSDIMGYEPARDRQQIFTLFRNHWKWLVTSDDYPMEYVFDELSPEPDNPAYLGKMKGSVLRQGDKLIGFITYYMQSETVGRILFLAIDESAWGKRYGQQLIQYSIKQLQAMGAKT